MSQKCVICLFTHFCEQLQKMHLTVADIWQMRKKYKWVFDQVGLLLTKLAFEIKLPAYLPSSAKSAFEVGRNMMKETEIEIMIC